MQSEQEEVDKLLMQCQEKVEKQQEMDGITEIGSDSQAKKDCTNGRMREIINQFNKKATSEMREKGYTATLKCKDEDEEI